MSAGKRSEKITCGFIPLVDVATLAAAKEIGFAAEEGLDLELQRENSWSNIRDKLALGLIDAAHMLAPMPIAMSLGLSRLHSQVITPFVLSVNGNVVGVSRRLARRIETQRGSAFFDDPVQAGASLKSALEGRPLRVGVPWTFSMHALLVQYWLGRCGFDLGRDVTMTISPPAFMAETLAADEIDLFCGGEPWGSFAVENEVAELLLTGASIWSFAPEKTLGLPIKLVEERGDAVDALLRACWRAAQWASAPEHREPLAELLSAPGYLDQPAELIERSLRGVLTVSTQGEIRRTPRLLELFDGAAPFPWRSQAAWIADRYAAEHRLSHEDKANAESVFRPDLLRRALGPIYADLPSSSSKIEGSMSAPTEASSVFGTLTLGPDAFFDGAVFDPEAH